MKKIMPIIIEGESKTKVINTVNKKIEYAVKTLNVFFIHFFDIFSIYLSCSFD